jgi:gas vesicle protein
MTDRNMTGLYCFLGGLGAGVAVGILFAPDSGAGTRESIRRRAVEGRDLMNAKADEGREYVKRQGAKLIDQTNDFVERGKRVVNEQKEKVTNAVEAGTAAYRASASEPSLQPAGR